VEETQDIRTFIARIDTHGCKAVGIYKVRGIYGQWGAQHGPPTTEVRGNSQTVCQPSTLPPEVRATGCYTSSRMIIDACEPYLWLKEFPLVNAVHPELRKKVSAK